MREIICQINKYAEWSVEQFVDEQIKNNKWSDELSGGKADQREPRDFQRDQLIKGIKIEFEHTYDMHRALEIVLDHLVEYDKYYDELEKMEKSFEEKK